VIDGGDRDDGPGCGREARIDRDQRVSLQPGDREVLGVPERVPAVLTRNLPGGAAGDPVTEQPHFQLGQPLVCFQGCRFGAPARENLAEQQFQRLGADRIRRDQLMARVDAEPGVHEVEQGRRVNDVAGH